MCAEDARVKKMLKMVRTAAEVRMEKHLQLEESKRKEKTVEMFVQDIFKERNLVHQESPMGEIHTFYSGLDFVHFSGNLAKYHLEKLVSVIKMELFFKYSKKYLSTISKLRSPDPLLGEFCKTLLNLNNKKDSLMVLVVKQIKLMKYIF